MAERQQGTAHEKIPEADEDEGRRIWRALGSVPVHLREQEKEK